MVWSNRADSRAFVCSMPKMEKAEKEEEGIHWQPQVERRWLANLLGNEKAVAPFIKFLKTTGIGGREGAKEREMEWARKNDQAGETYLTKFRKGNPKVEGRASTTTRKRKKGQN